MFPQERKRRPLHISRSTDQSGPSVIRQHLNRRLSADEQWARDGLRKKGLACPSCERVSYVMDILGNRGRNYLDGRSVALFYSDHLRGIQTL